MLAPADLATRGLPEWWRDEIVAEITAVLGDVPILLAGSRGVGTALRDSDCDVVVVVALHRVATAARALRAVGATLTARLGVPVSVNPLPRGRLTGARGGLWAAKLRAEARVLSAPPGFTLSRRAPDAVSQFSAASYVLTATVGVLEAIDPRGDRDAECDASLAHAIDKAVLHLAQLALMARGDYAVALDDALGRLGDPRLRGAVATRSRGEALCRVRAVLLDALRGNPLRVARWKVPARNVQYAAIAALRGRRRWGALRSPVAAEVALAACIVALLEATGCDAVLRGEVDAPSRCARLPVGAPAPRSRDWASMRDAVIVEWADAHPLGGPVR